MSVQKVSWWLGFALVVLTGLSNEAGLFPPIAHRYIEVAAMVIGLVMAYLKQSPLPDNSAVQAVQDPANKPFIR